ncbi:hypothetical protein [Singulisphaera sp. PoT]|uniref:hypothetical protein n=1 Tax=Singulisphaera sp. PoT TaxID=3411797 RepID=UPI003BF4DB24
MKEPGFVRRAERLAWSLAAAILTTALPAAAWSQAPPVFAPVPAPTPVPTPADGPAVAPQPGPAAPGTAVVGPIPASTLPHNVQVVRFQAPEGAKVEILGPPPEPVPSPLGAGDQPELVGLKVGVGYRLKISQIPGRPEAELYPVIQVVGHLHRPEGLDVSKFPIRIVLNEDDFIDAADHGRLVTHVTYVEDPEQAMPIALPKGEIPIVTLNPAEEPLKVGAALGRVMAIIRIGGRKPMPEELNGSVIYEVPPGSLKCPFTTSGGEPCGLPCGPVRGTPPPPGRPWVPKDEYLCDGGDHAEAAHFGGDGGLLGIDPRDAVVQFDDTRRARILPTNLVCVYAPRFATVRSSVGPNEALTVLGPRRTEKIEGQIALETKQRITRLVQNQAAQAQRERVRPSGMKGRAFAGTHVELRVLNGYDTLTHIAGRVQVDVAQKVKNRQKADGIQETLPPLTIKTAESAVITGIVQGAGQAVMTWPARETVGVEEPPKKPGLAVIKRVSASEAEQGDTLTFVIQYRNMGNTPITSVSVVDSLLPRLQYVARSAKGPKGSIFTAEENRVGSTELRWDLPGALAPGSEGYVSFEALVR